MQDKPIVCSFCNRTRSMVTRIIQGPNNIYICDDCIASCAEILENDAQKTRLQLLQQRNAMVLTLPLKLQIIVHFLP